MSHAPDRRLLLVHAHPDDESINNGATMAKYAAEGARVTLVTCTLGEEGEVIPPELAHLAPQPPAGAPDTEPAASTEEAGAPHPPAHRPGELTPLARHRKAELAAAMSELGVIDHRFLGGPGRYRDSGMMGAPDNDRPGCFWQAPLDEAALELVPVIREVRPQVLITYDPEGGYGHPDHVKAHRVAMRAARLAADPGTAPGTGEPYRIPRIYWNCTPRSAVAEGFAQLRAAAAAAAGDAGADAGTDQPPGRSGAFRFPGVAEPADVPGLVDDDSAVDVVVDGRAHAKAKAAAMRAHATQIDVDGEFFALSNGLGQPLLALEHYRLAQPAEGRGQPVRGEVAVAADLFGGLDPEPSVEAGESA